MLIVVWVFQGRLAVLVVGCRRSRTGLVDLELCFAVVVGRQGIGRLVVAVVGQRVAVGRRTASATVLVLGVHTDRSGTQVPSTTMASTSASSAEDTLHRVQACHLPTNYYHHSSTHSSNCTMSYGSSHPSSNSRKCSRKHMPL